MKIYKTVQGDTWDNIAVMQYGSELIIAPLLEANVDYLDMVVFPSGIQLQIPELPKEYKSSDTQPPWREEV